LETVRKSKELQPDLVWLDIGLPILNGLEDARLIRRVSTESRILFLSSYDFPELLQEAQSVGVLGFVVKSNAAGDLLPAVRAVMRVSASSRADPNQEMRSNLFPLNPSSEQRF
jgi:DNA-binding NarL/FixJ family response regulator